MEPSSRVRVGKQSGAKGAFQILSLEGGGTPLPDSKLSKRYLPDTVARVLSSRMHTFKCIRHALLPLASRKVVMSRLRLVTCPIRYRCSGSNFSAIPRRSAYLPYGDMSGNDSE
ncbi:hypothetical protein BDZ89DRAFT_1072817, partial [Hymenopellis radicata]